MEAFIPITMFLVLGCIVIGAMILKYHKRKLESQEILAAIEKGVDVKFPETKTSRLLPGLIWLLTGLVMTFALMMVIPEHAPNGIWIWGLTPVAVGASFLIVHRIESQENDSDAG